MRRILSNFHMPATCRLGWGAADDVGHDATRLGGRSALLVTSASLGRSPIVRAVRDHLADAGIKVVVDDQTQHAPDNQRVNEGARMFRENECDLVVSVGGGNPHDLAKGIGVVVANGGSFLDYEGVDRLRAPNPPHVAVNTTAGTGSELSHYAFITSHRKGRRVMVSDRRITPRVAINDPSTHLTMSRELTASSGMSVLAHAVEAYLATSAMPLTDSMALDAIELVGGYLERAVRNGRDEEARTALAQAEQLAGMAYNSAGLGLADAISLTVSAVYDVPHGECNAVVLPYVMAFNLPERKERLAEIARVLLGDAAGSTTGERARAAPEAVQELARGLPVRHDLRSMGVDDDVAYMCLWSIMRNPLVRENPRLVTEEALNDIFLEAVDGEPAEASVKRHAESR